MTTTMGEQIAAHVAVTQTLPPVRNNRAARSPIAKSAVVARMMCRRNLR